MRTLREIYNTDNVWEALPEDLEDAPDEVKEILRQMERDSACGPDDLSQILPVTVA